MQSAACAVFNISRARMMEHLPRLNQCNFENLMARSIIRVRSGALWRHRVSLLWMTDRTNWQEVVPPTPRPTPPLPARPWHHISNDAVASPHSTQVTQVLTAWWVGPDEKSRRRRTPWSSESWLLIIMTKCFGQCAKSDIFAHLKSNFVQIYRLTHSVECCWDSFLDITRR